jgi:TonB-linked SusC/RagA family outer membrane protein
MQKKPRLFAIRHQNLTKFLLRMKLVTVLILIASLQLSAKTYSQQRITLKLESAELKAALKQIEKKSIYRFLYNNDVLNSSQKVSIDANNELVTAVLDNVFNTGLLTYRILENNLVVITQKNVVPPSQDIKVTGRVTNNSGEPIPSVTVKIKGASVGTSTDATGNYSLSVPDGAKLVFSSVGYLTQEVAVNGRTEINVVMQIAAKDINEVVVIGYGSASKRDLTGSIVKIAGKDVADKPNTNPLASLQGKVAGLSVVSTGKPGQEPDIRLRGTVSLTTTKPLYIVDGIFNDNIDFLNPADIESIEVLKDASSLAIFGVRGANGAIVVTSKKGKVGQMTVNFNTSVGVQKISDKVKLVDAAGFKSLLAEEYANLGLAPYDFKYYTGNTDWQDAISQKGIMNVNNLSITSGTEKNKFYMGIGYINQEGLIKHELLKKYSLNIADELKVSKAIKLGFNINAYNAKLPQFQNFEDATRAAPIFEPYNGAAGAYNQTPIGLQAGTIPNPLRVVEETAGQDLSNVYRAVGNVYTEVNFLKNFTFKATYYADIAFNNNRRYTPIVRIYNLETKQLDTSNRKTQVSQKENTTSKFQQDYLLTFKKQYGNHGLTVLGGFSTILNTFHETNGLVSQADTIIIPNDRRFWYLDNFYADPTSRKLLAPDKDPLFGQPLPLEWEQSTVSYFARVLYNYQGKYMLNASFRRDGSSDVSPNNRFQNFYAVGAAWELTKEKFMQNQKNIDFLKLKASYGVLGNQYARFHYPFFPLYVPASGVFGPAGGQNIIPGYEPAFIPDENLRWETITSTDIGVEAGLLRNRLHVEAIYFNKVTKDLLTSYKGINGTKPGITNVGQITNNGIELSAAWNDKLSNGMGYSISGNITTLRNKVNSVFKDGYEIFEPPTRTRAGDPIGSFYGYEVIGIYQDAADSANSPNNGYRPGELKYRDIDGDKQITDKDRTIIGNPTPKGMYGFSIGLNYKGFDFSMDFQGVYGNQIYRQWGNGANYGFLTYRADRLNRWRGPGTSNTEPRINEKRDKPASTYYIENGSYLRLRNLQLGYTVNPSILAKAHIKSARVYVSVQNLKTFKHNSGYTPEFGGSPLVFGVDVGTYPVPAIFTAGLNLNF